MGFEPPIAVWAVDHVRVQPSAISGRGLFAGEDIAADTVVFRLGGHLVSTDELDMLIRSATAAGRYVDTITVFEDEHLVLPDRSIVHFANHSCDPNLWHDGPFDVRSRRAVAAGEELTMDYGTNSGAPGFAMPCSCGTPLCRRRVTSDDWRLPDLQRRYEGHWVPALAARISSVRGASD